MQPTKINPNSIYANERLSAYQLLRSSTYQALRETRLRDYNPEVEMIEQKYARMCRQFQEDKMALVRAFRANVWHQIEEVKNVKAYEFDYYFIGLKGECFKEFKLVESQFMALEDELIETTFKDYWLLINKRIKKSNGQSKDAMRSLKLRLGSRMRTLVQSSREDRRDHMKKLNTRIRQFFCNSFGGKTELFDQFYTELNAEIFAITREKH